MLHRKLFVLPCMENFNIFNTTSYREHAFTNLNEACYFHYIYCSINMLGYSCKYFRPLARIYRGHFMSIQYLFTKVIILYLTVNKERKKCNFQYFYAYTEIAGEKKFCQLYISSTSKIVVIIIIRKKKCFLMKNRT